ncbi:hypothetical protein QVD17_27960 [Tagetes erecta]|uniref:Uncharacterized protein n=1 Tax=Tagetes erecta TaxID=13708 RepID=A0AAD8KA75_TARER|nr:hypothetical protein QVD17_27960 [Tagetes erecta]
MIKYIHAEKEQREGGLGKRRNQSVGKRRNQSVEKEEDRETKCSNLTKSQTLKPKKTPPVRGVLFALVSFPVACTKKTHTSSKPSFSSSLPLGKQSHNTSLCRCHNQTEVRSSPPPPGRAPLPRHLRFVAGVS